MRAARLPERFTGWVFGFCLIAPLVGRGLPR